MTNAARLTDCKKACFSAAFGAGVPVIKNHIGGAVAGKKAAERDAETNAATGRREESRSANAAAGTTGAAADIGERDETAADAGRETGGTPPRASVLFVPSVADKIFPVSEKVGKKTAFFKIFSNNGRGKENQIRRAAGKNTISRNGGNGE